MEEIKLFIEEATDQMQKAVKHTENEFSKIRAGKANPIILQGIKVEYYGALSPLDQVATVNAPDARTLVIKPWDKKVIPLIENAIMNSDLNLNPQNDGEIIRLVLPILTEERRKDLVKQSKTESENGKIRIRNIRKDINADLKALLKEGASEDDIKKAEDTIQQLTDKNIKKIDELLALKEADIMTI